MITLNNSYIIDPQDYQIIQRKEAGYSGILFLVEHKKTKERLAAKVSIVGNSDISNQNISREIAILMRVQAPTIVRFYGFSLVDFNGSPNVTIFMEYKTNGSLNTLIAQESHNCCPHNYNNTAKQIILCGIAHGMMNLHSRLIIHRDLKPENVLLDSELHPYITDFGFSKFLDPENQNCQSQSGLGTPAYMAPELINGELGYGPKVDVYAFGILMFEVIAGERAFTTENKYQIAAKVMNGYRPQFKIPIKPCLQKLIERCLSEDPNQRPTFREIFDKLSLSQTDESVQSQIKDMISNGNDGFDYECRYCLEDVEHDILFDYLDEIKNTKSSSSEYALKKKIEEQSKRITQLEQEKEELKRQTKLEIEDIKKKSEQRFEDFQTLMLDKFNQLERQNEQKIEQLKMQLKTIDNQKVTQEQDLQTNDNQNVVQEIDTQINEIGDESSNPLKGLTNCKEIKQKIEELNLRKIIIPSSLTTIEGYAFCHCKSLVEVIIPNSITSIRTFAFSRCSSLKKIKMPNSITKIDDCAFFCCYSLAEITLPPITRIESKLFLRCKSISKIYIPSSVTSIGLMAFADCTSLKQISIPSSVTILDQACFVRCTSLTEIALPSSLVTIGTGAFIGCTSLIKIELPSSITSIGDCAFEKCSSLKEISIPPIKEIQKGTFAYCTSLTEISIPPSVTKINVKAFYGCESLKHISIPSSTKKLGQYVLGECPNLDSSLRSYYASQFNSGIFDTDVDDRYLLLE